MEKLYDDETQAQAGWYDGVRALSLTLSPNPSPSASLSLSLSLSLFLSLFLSHSLSHKKKGGGRLVCQGAWPI